MAFASAAFSTPVVSLVLAALIAAGVLVFATRPSEGPAPRDDLSEAVRRSLRRRYGPERRTVMIVSIAVIILFLVEHLVSGYALDLIDEVAWWRYATPLFVASVGIGVVLALILTRGTAPAEAAVLPVARRTWRSFSARPALIGTGILVLVLAVTTVLSGLASTPNSRGWYVWLEIPIANEPDIDPVRPWFYGWAYGLPVLVCLLVLVVVAWAALRANAVRPYLRPETVPAEREARRRVATGIVRITAAAMLLALAGSWRLIAAAGTISSLTIEGQNGGESFEAAWRYAELAVAAGWFAPLLEIAAFVLLLITAVPARRSAPISTSPAARAVDVAEVR
ncbi:hypothetical protein [Microbacterium sp. ZKA21]|uniref:hypothetical protein n=1 Tax=Microbacterium sp. ZKA21 TaxID=3381694 RepID=UPI003D23B1DA